MLTFPFFIYWICSLIVCLLCDWPWKEKEFKYSWQLFLLFLVGCWLMWLLILLDRIEEDPPKWLKKLQIFILETIK